MKQWKKKHYNITETCELKMYPCVLRTVEFRSRKEHNKAENVGKRAFPSSLCGNAFYSKQNMFFHVKRAHRDRNV